MENLFYFLIGRVTSYFGVGLLRIALPIFILEKTGSASALGTFMALTSLPAFMLSPILGNYLESLNKKYIMITTDFIQFMVFSVLYILEIEELNILWIYILLSFTLGKAFEISSSSIFSQIIEDRYIEKGNSYRSILDNLSGVASPIIGVFIYNSFGIGGIFLINAITFLFSAITEIFIKYKFVKISLKNSGLVKNLSKSINFILKDKNLSRIFFTAKALNFIIGPISSITIPFLLLKVHKFSNYEFGLVESSTILGAVIGAAIVILKNKNLKLLVLLNINSILIIVIGITSWFLWGYKKELFFIVLFMQFLIGFFANLISIPIISNYQRSVPVYMQSRFFALSAFLDGVLIPIGEFGVGKMSLFINSNLILIVGGVLMIFIAYFLLKEKGDRV